MGRTFPTRRWRAGLDQTCESDHPGRYALPGHPQVLIIAPSGVTYCLAHHVRVDGAARTLMIGAIRYVDTFVKSDATWFFSQRKLVVDRTETRTLATS